MEYLWRVAHSVRYFEYGIKEVEMWCLYLKGLHYQLRCHQLSRLAAAVWLWAVKGKHGLVDDSPANVLSHLHLPVTHGKNTLPNPCWDLICDLLWHWNTGRHNLSRGSVFVWNVCLCLLQFFCQSWEEYAHPAPSVDTASAAWVQTERSREAPTLTCSPELCLADSCEFSWAHLSQSMEPWMRMKYLCLNHWSFFWNCMWYCLMREIAD